MKYRIVHENGEFFVYGKKLFKWQKYHYGRKTFNDARELIKLLKQGYFSFPRNKVEQFFHTCKEAISASILCIRFPFLYPRNRFTDTHTVFWKFRDWTLKFRNSAVESWGSKENGFKRIYNNKLKWYLGEFFFWLHDYPMQIPFCIPTYTELDGMERGWRKAFGIQYMQELKKQLKKDKMLYKWRIMDIKEKYGTLRVYCNYGSKELYNIIDKYEELSYHTCIRCGKPATKISKGWISPYCDDCLDSNVQYVNIGEDPWSGC